MNLFLKERKRNVVRSKCFAALALTGMALTSTANGELVIDDFTSPDGGQFAQDNVDNDIGTWKSRDGLLPVLGNSREIFVTKTQGNGDQQGIRAEANGSESDGIFAYDQYTSTYAGFGKLIYDGIANDALDKMGLGGIDITGDGSNASFLFEDVAVTGSGLELTVNLYNAMNGNIFTSGPVALSDNFRGNFLIDYASFTGVGGSGTLANVGAIEVLIDGQNVTGSDMTIGRLTSTATQAPPAVPEPSSLILAGLASIGGLGFRFRRGKKKEAAAAA